MLGHSAGPHGVDIFLYIDLREPELCIGYLLAFCASGGMIKMCICVCLAATFQAEHDLLKL